MWLWWIWLTPFSSLDDQQPLLGSGDESIYPNVTISPTFPDANDSSKNALWQVWLTGVLLSPHPITKWLGNPPLLIFTLPSLDYSPHLKMQCMMNLGRKVSGYHPRIIANRSKCTVWWIWGMRGREDNRVGRGDTRVRLVHLSAHCKWHQLKTSAIWDGGR